MKRMISILLALLFLFGAFGAGAETNEELMASSFVLRHADRSIQKVAITVDDCYQSATEWIRRDVELCRKYGIAMTFFPLVYTGCLEEKYRDLWQEVLDSGCEIGTHSNRHVKFGNRDAIGIIGGLGRAQEALDKTLGYHYEVRWLRPPYGSVDKGKRLSSQSVIKAIQKYGFEHIVDWDVSETVDLKKALKVTQNGSILLFHSKKKIPKGLLLGENGYIIPESYVKTRFVEDLYRRQSRMAHFLRSSSKAKIRLDTKDTEIPSFKDHIIIPVMKEMCRTLFSKDSIKDLLPGQQAEILRQIRFRFSSNVNQLVRVTEMPYEDVVRLLETL